MLRRNVLILHSGALGDFVLTWPLIMALARLNPQSRIIIVTQHSKGALAEVALHVEHADVEAGWHAVYSLDAEPDDAVARLLTSAHAIYSFISAPNDAASANLARIAGPEAKLVTLQPRPPEDFQHHATDFLLQQLALLPILQTGARQMIHSINTRGISAGRSDGGDVVVHPGSGGADKCWPADRFLKLINKLKRKKKNVRVLLGEVELERLPAADIAAFEATATVRRPATYIELLNELRTASHYIGNDTGPSHLAAVIGVPTTVLFGPSNPAVWKPLGPRVDVLHHQPLSALSADEVFAVVR